MTSWWGIEPAWKTYPDIVAEESAREVYQWDDDEDEEEDE